MHMFRWNDNIKVGLNEIGWEGMDWINKAQDRDKLQARINTEWAFWFHKMWGISLPAEKLLASQEWHCSMELLSELIS